MDASNPSANTDLIDILFLLTLIGEPKGESMRCRVLNYLSGQEYKSQPVLPILTFVG